MGWLETHWVVPAYSGGLLMGLTIVFFGAATNTLSGWLYVLSGLSLALLFLAAWLPPRYLKGITATRLPIRPTSAGTPLVVEITLENHTPQPKPLLQVRDQVPSRLGSIPEQAIAAIAPHRPYHWTYELTAPQRGLYQWDAISLRTGAPLGLFWCQRQQRLPAQATVYPQVFPLSHCPLIDRGVPTLGDRWHQSHTPENATAGLTRSLRPYRWGDPTRLIHWRSSARYGDLRVRELEQLAADNEVLLALDTRPLWTDADFEQAVSAIATLYLYALQKQRSVGVWMAHTGILQEKHRVLTALAAVMPTDSIEAAAIAPLPQRPLIWLSPEDAAWGQSLMGVWVCWPPAIQSATPAHPARSILTLQNDRPLAPQLQASPETIAAQTTH
jgi:uncharacterized protein (DUF58 family)